MTYCRDSHLAQLAKARASITEQSLAKLSESNRKTWAKDNGERRAASRLVLAANQEKALRIRIANALATRVERFWAKVNKSETCWLWMGAKNNNGYGQVRHDGKCRLATHYSLELDGRPRPFSKAVARHHCDNPACVNPGHLEWGSQSQNMQDAKTRGRANLDGLALGRGKRRG